MSMGDAETVVDESRIKLPAEIFARLHCQLGRKWVSMQLLSAHHKAFIHAAQKIWEPATVQFRRDDLEFGESLEHAGQDQRGEGALDLMRIDGAGNGSLFCAGVPIDP